MPSNLRLKAISIEAFRGFRDASSLDLDASTVILTGPNGTGKTSFFDAIQWVLLGSIERLEELRSRRNVEHVVNSYRRGERADVALVVSSDGRDVTCRRRGDYSESTLEVAGASSSPLFGEAAEEWLRSALAPHQPESLPTALSTCGLLQQDVMRSVLEAKPADRYTHISAVLGLSDLAEFEKEAREAAKRAQDREKAAEQEVQRARDASAAARTRVESVEERAQNRASVESARTALLRAVEGAPDCVEAEFLRDLQAAHPTDRAQTLRGVARRLNDLLEEAQQLVATSNSIGTEPSEDDVDGLRQATDQAKERVAAAGEERRRAAAALQAAEESSEQLARLAAAAIPLLGQTCPVCSQAIDSSQVETHLREAASESSTLMNFRQEAGASREEFDAAQSRLDALERDLASTEERISAWRTLRRREANLEASLRDLTADSGQEISISLAREEVEAEGAAAISYLNELASLLDRLGDALDEAQSTGDLVRARSELEGAQSTFQEQAARLEELASQAASLKQLAEAATLGRVDVTAERFEAIEPLVIDIYSRLDPHPAFKVIGFEHDTYYGKGTSTPVVRDVAADVAADPLIVFSASQANIAALSYFLAMSLGAGERSLPFVLLDDPLQSMDDVNVLGFADLCRFIRSERQLVLSTHDRRFANLLHRKLAPRRAGDQTVVHRFTGWDRHGPSIESEVLSYEPQDSALRVLRAS